jgi:DNA-binding response OmpR family regulator
MDQLKNLKILYVEDDELIRENTSEILRRKCNNVITAKNGIDGFAQYQQMEPDIIITDIQMPKMDGLTMIKKIRETDHDTKIIITTAYSDQSYLLDAVELQLVKYISKPLTWTKISDALNVTLKFIKSNDSITRHINEEYTYNSFTKTLYKNEKEVILSNHEKQLLELLIKHKNNLVQYEAIENFIWPEIGMSKDAIKSLTKGLRKKLPKEALQNIYGLGYKLNVRENE